MNRSVASLVLLLTFLAFAMIGGAGGMQASGEQTVHARGAAALSKSQQDRCQMAAFCLAQCAQCAVGMRVEIAAPAGNTFVWADLNRILARRTETERVFRPPKV